MRYGQANGIGAMVSIAVGVCVFAGWVYVCYPDTASDLADDSRRSWSFLVLLGFVVVAVFGASIAGSVLQGLVMLLRSLVQLSLIAALVVGGVVLWRRQPEPSAVHTPATTQNESPPARVREPEEPSPQAEGRWWEQHEQ